MRQTPWLLIFLVIWLAACAPAAETPDPSPVAQATAVSPTSQPTDPPTAVPTATAVIPRPSTPAPPTAVPTDPPPEPTGVPTDEPAPEPAIIAGRTEEGAFFLGSPDAPVTMIDYSDFL